jgi:LacI family transcriptional regulator
VYSGPPWRYWAITEGLVFLCESRDDRLREQHYLQALLGRRVDGIIVTGRRQDRREPIAHDLRVPVVYAMAYSSDPADLCLVPDDEDGRRGARPSGG